MSRRARYRRAMARYGAKALKEAGKLGELLECEPTSKAGRKIQKLIGDVASEMSRETREQPEPEEGEDDGGDET